MSRPAACALAILVMVSMVSVPRSSGADETCQSPFLSKVTGQEDFVYVWTLGVEGLGDGSDKLVTVGANPEREDYGRVVSSVSVGGRHEAHHGGFTDDRRYLWVGGLDDSAIYVFDVATDPARPKLARTITDFVEKTGGVVGPHTFYALPGRMLITGLSNAEDDGGRTALVEYGNDGRFVRTIWMPKGAEYGYDVRVNANLNRMLTSSFTGRANYMRPLGELLSDAEAMKRFGNTMVVWDYHARRPLQVLEVPGAPLEIRWALQSRHHYAFTTTALTSKLWGVFRKDDGGFEAVELATIGDPAKVPLPVDISLSADDRFLFVDTFNDGMVRVYDVSNPRAPRLVHERRIGSQVNMVSQSWDGRRVYFTSSLLANWDGTGHPDEQFLKAFHWDEKELRPAFEIDFRAHKLGRPHIMRFGQLGFWPEAASSEPPALYEPPAPGTYALPPLDRVGRWHLLDSRGGTSALPGVDGDEVAVIAFVYRGCHQTQGCTAALAMLQRLDREIARDTRLSGRVRLVTVSFDPRNDSPADMAQLREALAPHGRWDFLTAADESSLRPILEDFGQDAVRTGAERSEGADALRHVLKVFLVDGRRDVRNVYSAEFLRWQLVRNDLLTVLGSESIAAR